MSEATGYSSSGSFIIDKKYCHNCGKLLKGPLYKSREEMSDDEFSKCNGSRFYPNPSGLYINVMEFFKNDVTGKRECRQFSMCNECNVHINAMKNCNEDSEES